MIYLISDASSYSGINTWNINFMSALSENNVKCTLIDVSNMPQKMDTIKKIKNSVIVFNNIRSIEILNKKTLIEINDNNNRIYIVIHSDICPTNKSFIIFNDIFYGVISISKKVKSIILKHYPTKHVIYFPNRISNINTNITRKFDINRVRFGFVGRISKEKNIPLILRAFSKYKGINNNCILNIFGSRCDDAYDKYIDKLIKLLEIGDNIIRHGHVTNTDDIYNNIDILLVSSISEGIPYCIIEASHYNIPVITTNVGCISEIIKHKENGILFNLDGYPHIKDLFVNNYNYILHNTGYVSYIKKPDSSEITDTKLHLCKKQVCMINTTYNIISPLDCKINSTLCDACVELLSKNTIFKKNIDILVDNMTWSVTNYNCFNVFPIYKNEKLTTQIKELVDNKIYDRELYDKYYPFNNENNVIIDTSAIYGVYYLQEFRPLPYIITVKYKIKGSCYMFICHGNKNDPFITKDLNENEQILKINVKIPGYYKVGFKFRDDCTCGLLDITYFTIKMCDIDIPIGPKYLLSKYDIKIIDPDRYVKDQNLNNMLFMFVTCRKPQYADRRTYLYNFVKTFNYKYIIVEGDSDTLFFDSDNNVLHINIEDIYENLPQKIIKAYEWIYKLSNNITHIYKVDDDFCDKILNFVPANFSEYNYYGNFIVESLINTWHQGKCDSKILNNTIYSKDFIGPYAGGGFGYILSKKTLKILINNKDEIINSLYEDKAIGDVLYVNNIRLNVAEFVNTSRIINNQTIDFKAIDINENESIITCHAYNNKCLLYIITDNHMIYQHYFDYLPTISFNNNYIVETKDKNTINLFHCNFCDVNIKSSNSIDISSIKVSEPSTKTDIGIKYDLVHGADYKIELANRIWVNIIYLIKWHYLKLNISLNNINSINKLLVRVCNIHEISYDDINNNDVVFF